MLKVDIIKILFNIYGSLLLRQSLLILISEIVVEVLNSIQGIISIYGLNNFILDKLK